MAVRLTSGRDLAKKVTAHAADAEDARTLLLAMGLLAEDTEVSEQAAKVGSDYVPPAKRRAEWTRMAGEMHADGRSTADIAAALAIEEDMVAELVGDWWAGVGR